MPTNHTPNYSLSQWARADRVLMEDFNGDNAKLDGALTALAAADSAETQARTAAVEALSSTLAAHTAAIGKLGSCLMDVQAYTGHGGGGRSFSFAHMPVAVFVQGTDNLSLIALRGGLGQAFSGGAVTVPRVTWGARSVSWSENTCNRSGTNYILLALLDASK